jgi:uncharacterized protein (TIGR03067 family)
MLHFPLYLCCLFLLSQEDPSKSEFAKLQGDWQIASGTLPDSFQRKAVYTFRQDKLIITVDQARTELRLKLDPAKQPKEIDMLKGDRRSVGIYELKEDQLRLCYEVESRAPRPQRFEVVAGTEVLLVLKRRK